MDEYIKHFHFVLKPGHSTELEEWRSNGVTPESFKDKDSFSNARNLTQSRHSNGSSRSANENCAKNLLEDFSAEVTNATHRSARFSSGQHPEELPVDNDSAPVSPAIPARFRKISNITPPRVRRKMGTGECSLIIPIYFFHEIHWFFVLESVVRIWVSTYSRVKASELNQNYY